MWSVEASGIGSPSKSLSDIITGMTFGKGKARLALPVKAYVILAVGWKAASWWTSAFFYQPAFYGLGLHRLTYSMGKLKEVTRSVGEGGQVC